MFHRSIVAVIVGIVLGLPSLLKAEAPRGYYRFPALHGDTIVFTAEGDLYKVSAAGGTAQRLTSHLGQETRAAFSPDGETLAFSADYEGPTEVYVMPVAGGLPRRLTWEGAWVVGWTPGGKILYTTGHYSTLPDLQLVTVDPTSGRREILPLSQASEGAYDDAGEILFFTRFSFQGSYTKRYRGGTAQNLWRFRSGAGEAVPLTADYSGTSREPMWWNGRLYFASDRDGTVNLFSIDPEGGNLRQHTHQVGWDVKSPDLSQGRIVYQLGADLHLLDLATGDDRQVPIVLASDFDQTREKWITEPMEYLTAVHLSPTGDQVVLTARGQVFVAPVGEGRLAEVSRRDGVRYRSARFLADGKDLVVLSDESGEVELWRLNARGVAAPEPLSDGGKVQRFDPLPSPDGRRIAYTDKNQELRIFDLETKRDALVATSDYFGFREQAWSPDSRWLAYVVPAENFFAVIRLYRVADGTTVELTSDRFDSFSPVWSPDGQWIYFLSNRNLVSIVSDPWGSHQPGPFLDRTTRIYHVALRRNLRSPFAAANELFPEEEKKPPSSDAEGASGVEVLIDVEGIRDRIQEVGVEPGNYTSLAINDGHLFWLSAETSRERRQTLMAAAIGREAIRPKKLAANALYYELAADGKKLLLRQGDRLFVLAASAADLPELSEHEVALASWSFRIDPREEWRQMFVDAWRLERDYFYDREMHGVDWPAMLKKYLPLVGRVTDRAELSDLFGELIGELSTLHHFVRHGDLRAGRDEILPASLGAVLDRDEAAGGYRVRRIYGGEPDLPEERSPLARPGVGVLTGDVLVAINGVDILSVADPGVLLRNQAGRQLLVRVREATSGELREAIVVPISPDEEWELRYDTWEYERRQRVEEWGRGEIGYVHLRAMRGQDYTEWARNYFPVANRQALIVDVRHNRGGNIDSWILGTLIRKPWMWWAPRIGAPYPNMQGAFRGHLVVLCDEFTMSDGEAFVEGFRRFGLGPVIGTRTWGGEIWLTWTNELVDGGIATAAEFGVYGPEGEWLIEGHGVDPDVVVDNLPHATFLGEDAQLKAAIDYLLERLAEEPREVPPVPPHPDKSDPGQTGTPEVDDPER